MKFVFPQNYKYQTKILGLMDAQTSIINLIWGGIIFLIVNFLFSNISLKISIFIILVFPVVILSIVGINGEDMFNVIIYMYKFIVKNKVRVYRK